MSSKNISSKVSFESTLVKDMLTLTLFDFEYETSDSIWEFEMMIVLK